MFMHSSPLDVGSGTVSVSTCWVTVHLKSKKPTSMCPSIVLPCEQEWIDQNFYMLDHSASPHYEIYVSFQQQGEVECLSHSFDQR